MNDDLILVYFAKSWGALYIFVFFIGAVIWTYWPSKRKQFEKASKIPMEKQDKPYKPI